MKIGDLFIKLGLQKGDFDKGLNDAKKSTSAFGDSMKNIGGMIAGVFAVGAITNFVSNIIKTRSEFEKYQAVLTNALGSSSEARAQMQMLQEVAAKTPFALTELTGAYVKLVNYGLKPTKEEIIKLGDLASSTGKGFEQLVEAVADSVTGQFERLKEFGIKASQQGDKVTFTFKEQKTTVDNNAQSIKAYMLSLGDLQGVSGSMAAISETLGGKVSNLGDSWDKLLNTLGGASSGIFVTIINWASKLLEYLTGISTTLQQMQLIAGTQRETENTKAGISQVEAMKKVYISRGIDEKEASKRALEIYQKEMDERISIAQKSRSEGASILKQELINEKNNVTKYYKDLADAANNNSKITAKTAKEELDAIIAKNKALEDEIEARRILKMEFYGESVSPMTPIGTPAQLPSETLDTKTLGNMDAYLASVTEKRERWTAEELQGWNDFVDQLNETISSGITDIIGTMAEGFGEMLGTGDWNWENFGKSALKAVGNFMKQMGTLLIAYAVKMALADNAIKAGPGAWPLVLAAGLAMVAAGSAISSAASKGVSGGGASAAHATASGYSNYSQSSGRHFLDGNVVFELKGTSLIGVLNNTDRKNSLIK